MKTSLIPIKSEKSAMTLTLLEAAGFKFEAKEKSVRLTLKIFVCVLILSHEILTFVVARQRVI